MHNIGRTVRETYETTHENAYEFENDYRNEFETMNESDGEYEFEEEYEQSFQNEFEGETYETDQESPFNEMEEMELATELLEVQNEAELDHFIKKLMGRAAKGGGGGGFFKSNAGRALGGILKKVAGKALPLAGRIAGGFFGGPVGAQIGSKIGSFASRAFGLELEGLSQEDQEFAASRAFVRFGGLATRRAIGNRYWRSRPPYAVRYSLLGAARRYAPGLLLPPPYIYQDGYDDVYDPNNYEAAAAGTQSGRWVRREGRIIVQGV